MKDLSNKAIIPAGRLSAWESWQPGELQTGVKEAPASAAPFDGLSAEQVQALVASLDPAAARTAVEPLPEPEEIETVPPAQQLGYPTAAELEAIHQEAWQAGHEAGLAAGTLAGREQGLAAGRAEGLAEAQSRFAEAWAPLDQLASSFAATLAQLEGELAGSLLDLAVKLAERLVAAHLAADPSAVTGVLGEALSAIPTTLASGRLRVNPQDLEVARAFLQQERPETQWQWIEDASIARGGCLLESPSMSQDLTLPKRLAALSAALGLTEETSGDGNDAA